MAEKDRFVDFGLDFLKIDGEEQEKSGLEKLLKYVSEVKPVKEVIMPEGKKLNDGHKENEELNSFSLSSPDPYSDLYYDWVDLQLGGVSIPGQHPKGAKVIGKQIEADLYGSLLKSVEQYLDGLPISTTRSEMVNGVSDIVDQWAKEVGDKVSLAFDNLYRMGLKAGILDAGIRSTTGIANELVLEFIRQHPNTIAAKVVLFSDDLKTRMNKVISSSFTADYEDYDLNHIIKDLKKEVKGQRYQLERIARTETASISNAGRLLGWSKDEEKYLYKYHWNNVKDGRSKEISLMRGEGNPYTYDEILFLWQHQKQMIGDKWQDDTFNQRCSLSRSPNDEEFRGNRFSDSVGFAETLNLGL